MSYLLRALTLLATTTGVGLLYLLAGSELAADIQRYGGFWIMAALGGLAVASIRSGKVTWGSVRDWVREHRFGILAALAVSLFHHLHELHLFKILFDEHVLLSMSQAMHESRIAGWGGIVESAMGLPNPTAYVADKRPLFFPFVLSLVHMVSGYRPENAFFLNGLLGFGLLVLLYAWIKRYRGEWAALFVVVLFGGSPLLAQNVTGGGFEVMNLFLILGVLTLSSRFIEDRGASGLAALTLCALCLANVRYESLLFAVVPGVALLLAFRRHGRDVRIPWVLSFAPLGLLSAVVAQKVFHSYEIYYQSNGEAFISPEYFQGNLAHALYYLFNFDGTQNNDLLISILGTFGILSLIVVFSRTLREKVALDPFQVGLLGFVVFAVVHTCLILCLRWGAWDDPMVSRFTLPLQLLMACAAGELLHHVHRHHRLKERWALIAVAAYFCAFALPAMARAGTTYLLTPAFSIQWAVDQVERLDADRSGLVLAASPIPYANNGHFTAFPDAPNPETGEAPWRERYLLGRYAGFLVVERLTLDFGKLEWKSDVPEDLREHISEHGEMVAERMGRGDRRIRIWRFRAERSAGDTTGLDMLHEVPLENRLRAYHHGNFPPHPPEPHAADGEDF